MITKPTQGLRFASLTRVSTEAQAAQGESLNSQARQIEAAVAQIGGRIVERYHGQEHAMEGYERKLFAQMLADAQQGKFEALVVLDSSRWSRDNRASKDAIAIFRRHGIRLFCLTQEFDLFDPQQLFMLGVLSEVAEFAVKQNLRKSAQSRIERAKKGFVTSGHPPYGRKELGEGADGTARWAIDEAVLQEMERAANLYLGGKTWKEVGLVLGAPAETIRRRVLASGSRWEQTFMFEGKPVAVPCEVPALLSDSVLQAVRAKSESHHINRKTKKLYALSRYIRCGNCGSVLSSHTHPSSRTQPNGAVYLQHHINTRRPGCFNSARYEGLERSILGQTGQLLKRTDKLAEAVHEAIASTSSRREEREGKLRIAKSMRSRLLKEHESYLKIVATLNLSEGHTKQKIEAEFSRLDAQIQSCESETRQLEDELKVIELPANLNERIKETVKLIRGQNGYMIYAWPLERQRALMQFLFGGKSLKTSSDLGVFVDKVENGNAIRWTAKGWFGILQGAATTFVALADKYQDHDMNGVDSRFADPARLGQLAVILASNAVPTVDKRWSG